jgi:hypothetical protein
METKKDRQLEDTLEIIRRAFEAGHKKLAVRVLARWARAHKGYFSLSKPHRAWVDCANGPVGQYICNEWDGRVSDDEDIYPY